MTNSAHTYTHTQVHSNEACQLYLGELDLWAALIVGTGHYTDESREMTQTHWYMSSLGFELQAFKLKGSISVTNSKQLSHCYNLKQNAILRYIYIYSQLTD